jgi:hypothetical protein
MARKMIDIKLDGDEPFFKSTIDGGDGDFIMTESTTQHQRQLLLNNKGDFKESPTVCVGAALFLDEDDGMQNLMREITAQYSADGMDVRSISLNARGEIVSNAAYV